MFKKAKTKYLILGAILLTAIIVGIYWMRLFVPAKNGDNSVTLPIISTPAGWYLWGGGYSDATGTPVSGMTFGNQPINNGGNNTTTLIVINAHAITDVNSNSTSTAIEWTWLRGILDAGESQTSTQLWDVVNNKLVLGEVSLNPSGRYSLSYYLICGGAEYSFQLIPSPFLTPSAQYNQTNIINSPDAQVLREIVKEVAGQI